MSKLCEVIAVVSGKKADAAKKVTELYHKLQKGDLFDGIHRSYRPKADDGETLPSEVKKIQARVSECISEASDVWKGLWDLTYTLDAGNCVATGELAIDGQTFTLPVTTLLFLEKQLMDVKTFISKIPTLDPAHTWTYDDAQNMYRTQAFLTNRSKKIQKPLVVTEATKEHPAQVVMVQEDVTVGEWSQVHYSNRMTVREQKEAIARVDDLINEVKKARERANSSSVQKKEIGDALLRRIFGNLAAG